MHNEDKNFLKLCQFCHQAPDLLFFSTEHFHISFDAQPLMEGHLIIHSKAHCVCSGEIPDAIFHELNQIKNYLRELLDLKYGTACFYEQGRRENCHFQLHALPLSEDIRLKLREQFDELKMEKFDEIKEMYDRFGDYLFFESSLENKSFFPVSPHNITSDMLRDTIAQTIGQKPNPDLALIEKAKRKLNTLRQLTSNPFGALSEQL